ncbi:MAG: cytochrome P450 [Oleiphilaceae bacterium]|nr:cytochrome P450 [Oleiphilaceae bacterium]
MNTVATINGPKGRFVFGNLFDYVADAPQFLSGLQHSYGDIALFHLGRQPFYAVFDPELIGQVYVGQHEKFIKNRRFWDNVREIFGKGLITNEGESWKRQRKIAAPSFQPKSIARYVESMVTIADHYLDQWPLGKTLNAHDQMMLLTADIVAKALFGATTGDHGKKLLSAIQEIEHIVPRRVARPFRFLNRLPLPSNIRYKALVKEIEQEVFAFIEEHEREGDAGRSTLLQHLMNARYEDGSRMSHQQLRDEIINVFLAGHDTTAITLSWAYYLISMHPEVEARMVAELDQVLGGAPPTVETLRELTYTKQVIQECLRLYPAAPVMGREALQDVQLGTYTIPKGSAVLISPYVMHRLERYFDEPDKFKPERWTEAFQKSLPRHVFIAFGGGPRVCIGEHFSMMEAMVILCRVYQRFKLRYVGKPNPRYFVSITLPPRDGMPIEVTPRD